jgi:hypothetical protein
MDAHLRGREAAEKLGGRGGRDRDKDADICKQGKRAGREGEKEIKGGRRTKRQRQAER